MCKNDWKLNYNVNTCNNNVNSDSLVSNGQAKTIMHIFFRLRAV